MIRYECDKCGIAMDADDPRRFIVHFEIYTAVGHVDLDSEAAADPRQGLERVLSELAQADPDEIEDQTYRSLRFDLCNSCRREVLRRPLG